MRENLIQLEEGTFSFLQSVSGRVAWPEETGGYVEAKTGIEHEGQPCMELVVMRTRYREAGERYEFEIMCIDQNDKVIRQGTMIMPRSGIPSQIEAPVPNPKLNVDIAHAFLGSE